MFVDSEHVQKDNYNVFISDGNKRVDDNSRQYLDNHEIIYDTGADICVVGNGRFLLNLCTDFAARKHTTIVEISGERKANGIGIFPCFGNSLLVNDCKLNILSGIVAEKLYNVEHNVGRNYIVHINDRVRMYLSDASLDFMFVICVLVLIHLSRNTIKDLDTEMWLWLPCAVSRRIIPNAR